VTAPLPAPRDEAEREARIATWVDGWSKTTKGDVMYNRFDNKALYAEARATAGRLIPAVVPEAEEVVGWCLVGRHGKDTSFRLYADGDEAEDVSRGFRGRLCKVVAVPETPDPAPSGRVYKWEDGKLWLFGGGGVGWQHLDLPVSDIPHVAKLMGVKP
jgi:hypothetical protein